MPKCRFTMIGTRLPLVLTAIVVSAIFAVFVAGCSGGGGSPQNVSSSAPGLAAPAGPTTPQYHNPSPPKPGTEPPGNPGPTGGKGSTGDQSGGSQSYGSGQPGSTNFGTTNVGKQQLGGGAPANNIPGAVPEAAPVVGVVLGIMILAIAVLIAAMRKQTVKPSD